jgi:hypothetical protein
LTTADEETAMPCKKSALLHRLTGVVAVLVLLSGSASAQRGADTQAASEYDAAMVEYERNHWPEAYAALVRLADRGHPQAARIALQMWRYGPALYRTAFAASAVQFERWTRLGGCDDAADRACQLALQAR